MLLARLLWLSGQAQALPDEWKGKVDDGDKEDGAELEPAHSDGGLPRKDVEVVLLVENRIGLGQRRNVPLAKGEGDARRSGVLANDEALCRLLLDIAVKNTSIS